MNDDDVQLLARFKADRSEAAIAELIRRHLNLVYSAALRQVGGDTHAAQDVAQSVFIDLVRQSGQLAGHPSLTGWLYTSTRFAAANHRRTQARRAQHENSAAQMNRILSPNGPDPEPEPNWNELRPVIDDAMHELPESDREAILARHFERRAFAELGARLGITENAARMRVERALEKLREILARRGITSTAAALAVVLSGAAVQAAPAGLGAQVAKAVSASLPATATKAAAGAGLLAWLLGGGGKLAVALVLAAVVGTGAYLIRSHPRDGESTTTSAGRPAARPMTNEAGVAVTTKSRQVPNDSVSDPAGEAAAQRKPKPSKDDQPTLELTVLAADTGKPIANADLELPWAPRGYRGPKKLQTDSEGVAVIHYPADAAEMRVVATSDGYAATMLHWVPPRGRPIPPQYTVRLAPAVLIGGIVVDGDGKPVANAQVGWNHEDAMANHDTVESHDFVWMTARSDAAGRWSLNRVAAEMLPRLYGSATHPDYIGSPMVNLRESPDALSQLEKQTHVFHLSQGIDVQGQVVNEGAEPIADAKVRVGQLGNTGTRETTTDATGWFNVHACPTGPQPVTAEAEGYSAASVQVTVDKELRPLKIVLKPGRTVRLRIVDKDQNPIAKAWVAYDTFGHGNPFQDNKPVQAEFSGHTDAEGWVEWTSAPEGRLSFSAAQKNYMRQDNIIIAADASETTAELSPALTVFGNVTDSDTGQPIRQFRMTAGWPSPDPGPGAQWSTLDRFSIVFSGGSYRHTFEEGVIGGSQNPGYVFKFTADGYASRVSRVVEAGEGEVQLDIQLHPSAGLKVSVTTPEGSPAAGAEVGLAMAGNRLQILPSGFDLRGGSGAVLSTDASGQVTLQDSESVDAVIVIHPSGFGLVPVAEIKTSPTLVLKPWGHIVGTVQSGGKPAAGREYLLKIPPTMAPSVMLDFTAYRVTTDANGNFEYPKVPPGQLQLVRLVRSDVGGQTSWSHSAGVDIEVKAGEVTTVNLGNNGYSVVVRLAWPKGSVVPDAARFFTGISTPTPEPPASLLGDQQALMRWAQSPEIQAMYKLVKSYILSQQPDGSFVGDDIPPGNYTVNASVMGAPTPGKPFSPPLMLGRMPITLGEQPGNGLIDAGQLTLSPAP